MIDGKAVVIMVELKTPKKLPNNTINNETLILFFINDPHVICCKTHLNNLMEHCPALSMLSSAIIQKSCKFFVDELKEYLSLGKRITEQKAIEFFENDDNFIL